MRGPSTNFFQKLIQIHKMWLKLAKIGQNWQQLTDFKTFFGYFHVFQVMDMDIRDSFRMFSFKNKTFEIKSKNFIFGQFCQF
jgi:hypothetical protein